ncbi:hypothetical protein K504DRAFT_529706 [Pleomassaria siparia CBS 279.74]|uniref:Transmembrane protein n=1 Tax=Pleomassaria siparia CBS 279.74 TaxID=1314801 RepID=A0A6G1KRW1_9PLEO|nr:hypothetical protein K504DRAFT_529706 [Pleomassaria siparia CBS 279.74]
MYHLDGSPTSDTILSSVFNFTTKKYQDFFKKKEDVQIVSRPAMLRSSTKDSPADSLRFSAKIGRSSSLPLARPASSRHEGFSGINDCFGRSVSLTQLLLYSRGGGFLDAAGQAPAFLPGNMVLLELVAIKQTRRNRNPLRSVYIYMLWGEIVANIVIGVIARVLLDGILGPTVPVLFFILVCWVFEIQLLMQIIINRIALIADHPSIIRGIKWGTVVIITSINIAVFCIWIPAHVQPPVSKVFVDMNNIWDKVSKVLILIVDAYLNYYFLSTVKKRLVEQHGLVKYQPLVGFNAKLMVASIAMDAMLIGLMFLENQIVYIQFHPVVYMVKLNIEITNTNRTDRHSHRRDTHIPAPQSQFQPSSKHKSIKGHRQVGSNDERLGGIHCRTELNIVVESLHAKSSIDRGEASSQSSIEAQNVLMFGDEMAVGPLDKTGFKTGEMGVV